MEQEYKWKIPDETMPELAAMLHDAAGRIGQERLEMCARYFDTEDGAVYKAGVALRLRKENAQTVCCMKRTLHKEGALAEREEYEVEAETLAEGLVNLPQVGAPAALCESIAEMPLIEIARTEFTRTCYTFEMDGFVGEFAVDIGRLGGSGKLVPFEELEFEYKSGDAAAFHAYAQGLERRFCFIPQPKSKLARALAVSMEESGT